MESAVEDGDEVMTDSSQPKLCINCAHYARSSQGGEGHCRAPQNNAGVNLVSGEQRWRHTPYEARYGCSGPGLGKLSQLALCGIDGDWFELKPEAPTITWEANKKPFPGPKRSADDMLGELNDL